LAIAGAVNLKTIKPIKGKTSIGQNVLLGNYGLQRYTTTFQSAGEHASILLNYGHQKSDGFTIHNESRKDFVNATIDFQPNTKQSITSYFGFSNSYDERFGELTLTQYDTKDYSGNIDYIKRNAHSNVVTFRAGIGHTYAFNKNISNSTTIFGTGFNSNVSSAGGWTDKSSINYGLRSTFDTKFSVAKDITLSGITGVETQRQDAQTIGYNMKQSPLDTSTVSPWIMGKPYWVINTATSNNTTINATTSLFTEWTLALPKDVSITAGIGVSNMKITLNDRFNTATATRPTYYSKSYTGLVSPHVAINKVFSKQFSVYASYSKGYKAPVSSYFFITTPAVASASLPITSRINNDLVPEIGNQFEIGTKGNLLSNKLTYEVAFFNAVFSNKMTSIAVPLNATTTMYTYVVNGGKQNHTGIEALVKYTTYQASKGFFKSITPFANLTYSDFKYNDFKFQTIGKTAANVDTALTTDYSNKQVAGIAKILANVGVDFTTNIGLYGNVNLLFKDGMPITSDGVYTTKSYTLLNAKIGYQKALSKHFDVDINFGVNNITGTQYPFMVFVNQLPDAYLPAPLNANYFGGINLKYNF
jgi:iron complex outermembrane recepter protein